MLWQQAEHEPLTPSRWDGERAIDAVAAIVADAEATFEEWGWPAHPRDEDLPPDPLSTLYLGSAGMIWGLSQLGCSLDLAGLLEQALARYRAAPDFGPEAHAPSLWMGETGLILVALALGGGAGERERLRELVGANREHPTWELMWGSPGTAMAARAAGMAEQWQDSAQLLWERWDEASELWTQELYGNRAQFLGPAHGFAGNVHALRGLVEDEVLRARVGRALTANVRRSEGLANWPVRAGDGVGIELRVQWCHGAPGILATLGELMPEALALEAGELIWRAGPLRKGPGLCHGTAGNGYALLRLFSLTSDSRWLDRARCFAVHAIEQVERERRALGRGRYTLWTGDVGVALFARACLRGDPSFPTIDGW